MSRGSRMFSSAVRVGTRLKDWKMKPTRSRRTIVSCFSDRPVSSTSPIHVSPEVSRSRPAMHCIRVDLPDPEGPMIAVKAPVAELDVDPVDRPHLGVALPVDLGRAHGPRRGRGEHSTARRHRLPSSGPITGAG